jgi:hypothetical protein
MVKIHGINSPRRRMLFGARGRQECQQTPRRGQACRSFTFSVLVRSGDFSIRQSPLHVTAMPTTSPVDTWSGTHCTSRGRAGFACSSGSPQDGAQKTSARHRRPLETAVGTITLATGTPLPEH